MLAVNSALFARVIEHATFRQEIAAASQDVNVSCAVRGLHTVQIPQILDRQHDRPCEANPIPATWASKRYLGAHVHHLMLESRPHVNMVMVAAYALSKQCPEVQTRMLSRESTSAGTPDLH